MDKDDRNILGFIVYYVLILPSLVMGGIITLGRSSEGVRPEYISGMLTALSILFGFWTVMVAVTPEERIKNLRNDFDKKRVKFLYKVTVETFYVSFVSLFISVMFVYLTALGIIPLGWSLIVLFLIFAADLPFLLIGLKTLSIETSD